MKESLLNDLDYLRCTISLDDNDDLFLLDEIIDELDFIDDCIEDIITVVKPYSDSLKDLVDKYGSECSILVELLGGFYG